MSVFLCLGKELVARLHFTKIFISALTCALKVSYLSIMLKF